MSSFAACSHKAPVDAACKSVLTDVGPDLLWPAPDLTNRSVIRVHDDRDQLRPPAMTNDQFDRRQLRPPAMTNDQFDRRPL